MYKCICIYVPDQDEKKIYSSWNKTGNGSRISGKPMKEEICLNSTFAHLQ